VVSGFRIYTKIMAQEIFFSGSPNSDDDLRVVANGWYRFAKHLRSGTIEAANQYSRESYLGNALLTNSGLPSGTNRILGMCPNTESQAIMFLVYNSNTDHTIWLLNINSGGFTKVVQQATLNFLITDYVYHMFVNNGVLYWTVGRLTSFISDNYSEPKQIDIAEAIKFTAGLPSKYTTFTRRTFDFVKWPPPFGPASVYNTNSSQEANFLYGKMYKFRYRYIYINNEESALSPISNLPYPTVSEFATGRDYIDTQRDNIINVTINTGPDIVSKFEVLVSINDGPWFVYEQIDKTLDSISNNAVYTSVFNGNEALIPVEPIQRNYDAVPLVARCEVITPDRKVAFGDYIEGFNKIDINATLQAIPIEITGKKFNFCNVKYTIANIPPDTLLSINTGSDALDVQEGDVYIFAVYIAATYPDYTTISYTITRADYDNIQLSGTPGNELLTILGDFISATYGVMGAIVGTDYVWTGVIDVFVVPDPYVFVPLRRTDPKVGLFKGAVHEFGKQYYDRANRDGTVLATVTQKLYVPFDTEQSKVDFGDANNPFYTVARATDSDTPPDFATHYQWVKRQVPVSSFIELTGTAIDGDALNDALYRIELDAYNTTVLKGNYNHAIKVGDVVRLSRQGATTLDWGDYVNQYIEMQVSKYDPSFGPGGAIWVPRFDFISALGSNNGFVIQIYTPAPLDEAAVWREISEEFTILNPNTANRLHQGSTVTGTATNLATGLNTFELASWLVGTNGGNFEYLVGRTFNITADVPYTGVISAATYTPATGITSITASTNFTGAQTFGSITISLNQTALLPAIVNMTYGDVYTKARFMTRADNGPTAGCYTIDDFYYSDYYVSNFSSIGRVAIELADARQIRQKATAIHGGAFVDNSEINNLCRFDNTDLSSVLAMDEQWGAINKMVVIGYTIKCIQDRRENSIYVRNTFGALPDGNSAAGFDNSNTFGAWNQMKETYGTIHPNTVQVAEGQLYYYDHLNGTIVRSSNNGQDNICEGKYKYKRRINNFKIAVDTFGVTNAFLSSFLDEQNNEYQITVFDNRSSGTGQQGLVFRYDLDKWDHEVSYATFFTCNLGNYLVSVPPLLATVYRHGTGAQNTFYGTIYASQLSFCWNEEPLKLKRPMRIGLRTNREWTLTSFVTEGDASYPVQDTEVLAGQWKLREGYYWAQFLNDKNNVVTAIPSLATATLALQNGVNIRAYAATGLLTYTPTTGLKVVIFSVSILSQLSDPNI